jgi:hypothetical protein
MLPSPFAESGTQVKNEPVVQLPPVQERGDRVEGFSHYFSKDGYFSSLDFDPQLQKHYMEKVNQLIQSSRENQALR